MGTSSEVTTPLQSLKPAGPEGLGTFVEERENHGNLEGSAQSTGPNAALLAVGEWIVCENLHWEGASIFSSSFTPPDRLIVSIKHWLSSVCNELFINSTPICCILSCSR
jgi:hypothetical protein